MRSYMFLAIFVYFVLVYYYCYGLERDNMLAARKEERIKKLLEEEKQAHEFHAQPIAKGLDNPRLV